MHLEDSPNEYTLFKFFPCYKYQSEKDSFVKFLDDVYIASAMENMNKNAYINLASKGENKLSPKEHYRHDQPDLSEDENNFGGHFLANMHDDFMISFDKTTRFKYN